MNISQEEEEQEEEEDSVPPPYTGREIPGGDRNPPLNPDQARWEYILTAITRELSWIDVERGNVEPKPQHHSHGVELLDWVEKPGGFPGNIDPTGIIA